MGCQVLSTWGVYTSGIYVWNEEDTKKLVKSALTILQ